ncbi:MAG: F0F1 ATP synthase subunit gamma [Desulfococcaceae bacterium]
MQTTQGLKRKIDSTEDLQSVVKTMKSLAAVNIRQYERATQALQDYYRTVEMGLQVVLNERSGTRLTLKSAPKGRIGAVVFGSDQGMAGSLNEQIVNHALDTLEKEPDQEEEPVILAVGERAFGQLDDAGRPVSDTFTVPGSVSGITPYVQEIVMRIETWQADYQINRVFLFHSRPTSQATFRPFTVRLLPLDRTWLERLGEREWDSRTLPTFTMDPDALFSALVREYLFVSIFRAFVESLASENASRLASMQGAEKNIGERLAELNNQYNQQRQMSITEELLDIVAGFEAMKES